MFQWFAVLTCDGGLVVNVLLLAVASFAVFCVGVICSVIDVFG